MQIRVYLVERHVPGMVRNNVGGPNRAFHHLGLTFRWDEDYGFYVEITDIDEVVEMEQRMNKADLVIAGRVTLRHQFPNPNRRRGVYEQLGAHGTVDTALVNGVVVQTISISSRDTTSMVNLYHQIRKGNIKPDHTMDWDRTQAEDTP